MVDGTFLQIHIQVRWLVQHVTYKQRHGRVKVGVPGSTFLGTSSELRQAVCDVSQHVDSCNCHFVRHIVNRAYFSVYYYTKCVLLKAHCATLKMKMCSINFMLGIKTGAAECLLNSPNAKFLYFQGLLLIP